MPQRSLVTPTISDAPEEYRREYISDLARALELLIEQVNSEGELRGSALDSNKSPLVLKNLPTSATGLETGSVYNDSGTLKVVT
jgi:hypothetical protein